MSFRCPRCYREDSLYVEVEVPGSRDVDPDLNPIYGANHCEVDWSSAYELGKYGCGECEWEGSRDGLEEIGLDGEPLPNIHRDQISIEESLKESDDRREHSPD